MFNSPPGHLFIQPWFVEGFDDPGTGDLVFASFAVVPIPAAFWLLGSALGVLGWVRGIRYRDDFAKHIVDEGFVGTR